VREREREREKERKRERDRQTDRGRGGQIIKSLNGNLILIFFLKN
jgi:hypothetical protein